MRTTSSHRLSIRGTAWGCFDVELVMQKHARGCGPAAIAMITGKPYDSVCAWWEIDFDKNGLYFQNVEEFLSDCGYAIATRFWYWRSMERRQHRPGWPYGPSGRVELCNVHVYENAPVSHFVVRCEDGLICDPMFGKHDDGLSRYHRIDSISIVQKINPYHEADAWLTFD